VAGFALEHAGKSARQESLTARLLKALASKQGDVSYGRVKSSFCSLSGCAGMPYFFLSAVMPSLLAATGRGLLESRCLVTATLPVMGAIIIHWGIFMAEDLAPLVYRTALGDQRAFEQLYQQTSSRLYGVALALLRRRDVAEEVLQEAYIKVWHSAGTYQADRGAVST
jgi:hypothetical protein